MLVFSLNAVLSYDLALRVRKIIEQNSGMIYQKVAGCTGEYIENRKHIIAVKIDLVKTETWHKVMRNFDSSRTPSDLSLEEGLEHYTKATLKGCLNDICYGKKDECLVDIDILDGRSRDNMGEYGDPRVITNLFHTQIDNNMELGKLDRNIECQELITLLCEMYLTNEELFDTCATMIDMYMRGGDLRKWRATFNKVIKDPTNKSLYERFRKYFGSNTVKLTDIDMCFKSVLRLRKETFVKKSKSFDIQSYPTFEYKTEGGVLSCQIKDDYSTSIFDVDSCSMRDAKNKKKEGKVDLVTSPCKVSNKIGGGKKIYKIRIEDYLDYIYEETNLYSEHIDTEFLRWCGDFYIFILPSGKRYGFRKDHKEYMINVKRELLSNIICGRLISGDIIAMNNKYIYFCPNSKPRYDSLIATMCNGKVIHMAISEASNIEQTSLMEIK